MRATEKTDLWTPVGRFCIEAVRATLCAWLNQPNPRLRDWVEIFVQFELARDIALEDAGRLPKAATLKPMLEAVELSAERANQTIPYDAIYDECARRLSNHGAGILEALGKIADKLRYPNLIPELVGSIHSIREPGQTLTVEQALDALEKSLKDRGAEALLFAADRFIEILQDKDSPETLRHLADGLRKMLGEGVEVRARVEAWVSARLLKKGYPEKVLAQIGDEAQPWEQQLSANMKARLWTERSNALRMCGRVADAVGVLEATIDTLQISGETIDPELQRNLAILYREIGLQSLALEILIKLLPDAAGEFRLRILESIAATYGELGRYSDARPFIEEGYQLSRGPLAKRHSFFAALLSLVKSATGQERESLELLRELKPTDLEDPITLLPYASTLLNVAQHPELHDDAVRNSLHEMLALVMKAFDSTAANNNMRLHMDLCRLLALMGELMMPDKRNVFWELLDVGSREYEGSADPMALLALARRKWGVDRGAAVHLLLEFPATIAARYQPETNLSVKLNALSSLGLLFDRLVDTVVESRSIEDVRFVAELKRDMLGRIKTATFEDDKTAGSGFIAPDSNAISLLGGPIAVFEWIDSGENVYGLGTFISQNGEVTTTWLSEINLNLHELANRIDERLSTWAVERPGDPFDNVDWRFFESWLGQQLADRLPDSGHLVVIEHEAVTGLQWHVAAAPRWRTSYIPSWSTLLRLRTEDKNRTVSVGVAMVPLYADTEAVIRALKISKQRTIKLAADVGCKLLLAEGAQCDREGLNKILQGASIAKLLCHGYIDPRDNVIALMIAHEGHLPPAGNVASGTTLGHKHRFDWRDCQRIDKGSKIIFSAACSSGRSFSVGLSERVGLFSALRRFGVSVLVAPRWDIVASVVLPILDDAMEQYLVSGCELGEAIHTACMQASNKHPRWLAWSLSLEGDWKESISARPL